MKTIRIILADDHHIVRQGFKALLESQKGFSVVAEAGDGLTAVKVTSRIKPDVLVVDLMMPGLNGLEVARQIRKASPETKVIILSMYRDEPYVIEALQNGACGYVLKESNMSDLTRAIQEVVEGRHYLSSPLSEHAISAYKETSKGVSLDLYNTLTTREREVLHLVIEGLTSQKIAARLFISTRTVESHRANLMQKLSLKSRDDLIRYALQKGIYRK